MSRYPVTSIPDDPDNGHISANDAFDEVVDLSHGDGSVDCSAGGTIVLADAQFGKFEIRLTGSPAAAFAVEIPDYERFFLIRNDTDEVATVTTPGSPVGTEEVPPDQFRLFKYTAAGDLRVIGSNRHTISLFFPGSGFTVGQVLAAYAPAERIRLPAGLGGARLKALDAADEATTITMQKNGSNIGTIDIADGAAVATFTFNSDVDFDPDSNDSLEFIFSGSGSPAAADATLADIMLTIPAIRLVE